MIGEQVAGVCWIGVGVCFHRRTTECAAIVGEETLMKARGPLKRIVNVGLNSLLNETIRVRSDWFWKDLPHGPQPEVSKMNHR